MSIELNKAVDDVAYSLDAVMRELQHMEHYFLAEEEEEEEEEEPAEEENESQLPSRAHEVLSLLVPLMQAVEEARGTLEVYVGFADLEGLQHVRATLVLVRAFDDWVMAIVREGDEGKSPLATAVTAALEAVDGLRGVLTPVSGSA